MWAYVRIAAGFDMKVEERVENVDRPWSSYFLRPMRPEDIPQVARVERECFPTGWAVTPFKRELRKRSVAFLVACEARNPVMAEQEARAFLQQRDPSVEESGLSRVFGGLKGLVFSQSPPPPQSLQKVVGYVGLWFMTDEAHITAIGVRESYRRRGVGELLMLGSVEATLPSKARVITLEVRVSNRGAQALYEKYGFSPVGIRKGYYTDNREDAIIMTADAVADAAYRERLNSLRGRHAERWGDSVRILA